MKNEKMQSKVTEVGNKLLGLLERGVNPWCSDWEEVRVRGYVNVATGRFYSGQNVILLFIDRWFNLYSTVFYVGFHQAQELGLRMRKGSKSCPILLPLFSKREDEEGDDRRVLVGWTWANVFNLDCFEDTPEKRAILTKYQETPPLQPRFSAPDFVENLLATHKPNLIFDPTYTPCYIPAKDVVVMPPIECFKSPEGYAATLIHEMAHWTGHKSRLNRKLVSCRDRQGYAFEELVAEMASAIICHEHGIAYKLEQHASYIQGWIRLLKNEKTAFAAALKEAAKVSEYLTLATDQE